MMSFNLQVLWVGYLLWLKVKGRLAEICPVNRLIWVNASNNNNKVVDLGFEGFLLDEELADANPFLAEHQGTSFSASASSNFILRGWLLVAEWKWE